MDISLAEYVIDEEYALDTLMDNELHLNGLENLGGHVYYTYGDASEYVVIQLKRFDSVGRKLRTSVSFPLILTTQSVFQDNPILRLQSLIIHSGSSINSGHYFGYHRLQTKRDTFLYANDKVTKCISEGEFAKLLHTWYSGDESAYLLIYEKMPSTMHLHANHHFQLDNDSTPNNNASSPQIRSSYALSTPKSKKKRTSEWTISTSSPATTVEDSQASQGELYFMTPQPTQENVSIKMALTLRFPSFEVEKIDEIIRSINEVLGKHYLPGKLIYTAQNILRHHSTGRNVHWEIKYFSLEMVSLLCPHVVPLVSTSIPPLATIKSVWKTAASLRQSDLHKLKATLMTMNVNSSEVVGGINTDTVDESGLSKLSPTGWLRSDLINFFMSAYMLRHEKCICYNTFFMDDINDHFIRKKSTKEQLIRHSTSLRNPFEVNKIIIPINWPNTHWTFIGIDFTKKTIEHFDGLNFNSTTSLQVCFEWLQLLAAEQNFTIHPSEWRLSNYANYPTQNDNCSCGVYVIMGSFMFLHGSTLQRNSFSCQEDVPYCRLLLAHSIIHHDLSIL
jgi:hypothetical protein